MPYRTFLTWCVAAVLLWSAGASTACWQAMRVLHYHAMCQGADQGLYYSGGDTVSLSRAAFRGLCWKAPGEAIVGGRHFDVTRVESTAFGFRLLGYYDRKDDRLASRLDGSWKPVRDLQKGKVPPLFMLEATTPSGFSTAIHCRKLDGVQDRQSIPDSIFRSRCRCGPAGPPPKA